MNETTPHVEGPSWDTFKRFATFQEAATARQEILTEGILQVKVRWMAKTDTYAVKTRLDPSSTLAEEKREEKRKRKKKLSKKRRKK